MDNLVGHLVSRCSQFIPPTLFSKEHWLVSILGNALTGFLSRDREEKTDVSQDMVNLA